MVRRIIWSKRAEKVFVQILEFNNNRNKSRAYSRKLNYEIKRIIDILAKQPYLGRKTENKKIRIIIKGNYKIFYQIEPDEIVILLVWDTRQNPDDLTL